MKIVNLETHRAIRALVAMAEDGRDMTTVAELAERTDIPRPFLRKKVQNLNEEGILESSRGKEGGFRFAVLQERILLTRLIQIFQGSIKLHECLFRNKFCKDLQDGDSSRFRTRATLRAEKEFLIPNISLASQRPWAFLKALSV